MSYTRSQLAREGIDTDGVNHRFQTGRHEFTSHEGTAGGTIAAHRLTKFHTDGTLIVGTLQSKNIIGVNKSGARISTNPIQAVCGRTLVVTAGPITRGQRLKCADLGRVIQMNSVGVIDSAIISSSAGGNFGNQPANDGIEVGSDSASDTGTVTIIGTTNGSAGSLVEEVVTLTGTTFVSTVKTDWGVILAVKADAHVGTITVREASGNATVTTLATGTNSKGVETGPGSAAGLAPYTKAGGASTKLVGIKGKNSAGAAAAESATLNGTTNVAFSTAMNQIDEFYVGDAATATTTAVYVNATEEDENNNVGFALESATAENTEIEAVILP